MEEERDEASDDDDERGKKKEHLADCLLPAGRDLLLESPCKLKCFLALAAERPAEASTDWKGGGVSRISRKLVILYVVYHTMTYVCLLCH